LLNLAVNLLRQPAQRVYWIPAISLIVGLHFLPMASFLRVPSYWGCGVAMMGTAIAVTFAISQTGRKRGETISQMTCPHAMRLI
jgi:hypothetical protein